MAEGAAERAATRVTPAEVRPGGTVAGEAPPGHPDGSMGARATFADIFAVTEFRALWLAMLLSVAGDQLARVAMTILVYDRTGSSLLTALTFAVTFLPWLLGGVALAGLADRLPRRQVMICCDLARMALVGGMVAVSLSGQVAAALITMVGLLFLVTLIDSPFKSARSALIADILTGEKYVLGTAVTQITFQSSTVAGFALGGVVVAALGPRTALLIDALTFAASAVLLLLWVHRRPAAAGADERRSQWADMLAGVRLVFGDRKLRTFMLFGWLVTFYVVPMGLAAPYAARFHLLRLPIETGLVFAAVPLGTAVGAFVLGRLVSPQQRQRWLGRLAISACGLLTLCLARPGFILSLVIFTASGLFASYQVAANAGFVAAVPGARRGQAFGLANGGMQVLQGLWFVIAGAVAERLSPGVVIAVSGLLGATVAAVLTATGSR